MEVLCLMNWWTKTKIYQCSIFSTGWLVPSFQVRALGNEVKHESQSNMLPLEITKEQGPYLIGRNRLIQIQSLNQSVAFCRPLVVVQ
jgi:hypothetical protein